MRLAPGTIVRIKGLFVTITPGEFICVHAARTTMHQPRRVRPTSPPEGSKRVVFCLAVEPGVVGTFLEAALAIPASGWLPGGAETGWP